MDDLADAVHELQSSLSYLQTAFPQAREFQRFAEEAEKYVAKIEELRTTADEATLISLRRTVSTRLRDVRATASGRQAELCQKAGALLDRLPTPDTRRSTMLETPVAGIKYADQVNNLRIRLLRDYTRFDSQVDEQRRAL